MKDFIGIDKLGLEIFKRWRKLDILISNAAILGTLGPLHHQNEFIEVLNVNLISNHRLIRAPEPLLKNSPKPQAFFPSSTVANEARPFGVLTLYLKHHFNTGLKFGLWKKK